MALAQAIVKDAIVINGLQVGEKYTREQLVQALGVPTKIQEPAEFDEYPNAYTYFYGKDYFHWIDGEFYGFALYSTAFQVNGLIRVGLPITKIDLLGGFKAYEKTARVQVISWTPSKEGLYQWLSLDCYYNTNNVITSIRCFIQDM